MAAAEAWDGEWAEAEVEDRVEEVWARDAGEVAEWVLRATSLDPGGGMPSGAI